MDGLKAAYDELESLQDEDSRLFARILDLGEREEAQETTAQRQALREERDRVRNEYRRLRQSIEPAVRDRTN